MSARCFKQPDWEQVAVESRFQPRQMASMCHISLRQLERLFAAAFQLSPKAWLRELRCRLAMRLLLQGRSNKEVVAELHFASASHFCHDFRKIHPESPRRTAECLARDRDVVNGQRMSLLSNRSVLHPESVCAGINVVVQGTQQ